MLKQKRPRRPITNSADPARLDRWQRRCAATLLIGTILVFAGLVGRLAYINITLRPKLVEIAHRQQLGTALIPARRGMILDARGRVLAISRREPDVFVDAVLLRAGSDPQTAAEDLAAALGARLNVAPAQIVDAIQQRPHSRYIVIARHVDEIAAEAVRRFDHPAVGLAGRLRRSYPMGSLMAHVLGWVGTDGHGLEGLELAFDGHLRGRDGRLDTIRDARRRALSLSEKSSVAPVDGGHLVLTLDAEVQRIVDEALAAGVQKFEAESGVAIVMSPADGAVLAMATWPTFDPNTPFNTETAHLRRNRALTDPVEPGSSFKPIIACGALAGGFVSATEKIDCHDGSYRFGRRLITDTHPQGRLDLRGIVTYSSNIGMGQIAERMGNEALYETVRSFGFGSLTGIECPGDSPGLVYPLKKWNRYSTISIPIGYEILVTPLQLLTAFSAIVNDGILVRPRVVDALLGPDGQVLEAFNSPKVRGRATPAEVARYMAQEILPAVVEEGGGHRAKVKGYGVLGKTGTARLSYPDRSGYEPGAYLAVFVGAAPASDPQLAVAVMIRRPNPQKGYYGGVVAAPVVADIFRRALPYLGVPPEADGADEGQRRASACLRSWGTHRQATDAAWITRESILAAGESGVRH